MSAEEKAEKQVIHLYRWYRFGRRKPILVTSFQVDYYKRAPVGLSVTGFASEADFRRAEKFHTIAADGTFRTVAEVEGLRAPPRATYRFKRMPKMQEVANA